MSLYAVHLVFCYSTGWLHWEQRKGEWKWVGKGKTRVQCGRQEHHFKTSNSNKKLVANQYTSKSKKMSGFLIFLLIFSKVQNRIQLFLWERRKLWGQWTPHLHKLHQTDDTNAPDKGKAQMCFVNGTFQPFNSSPSSFYAPTKCEMMRFFVHSHSCKTLKRWATDWWSAPANMLRHEDDGQFWFCFAGFTARSKCNSSQQVLKHRFGSASEQPPVITQRISSQEEGRGFLALHSLSCVCPPCCAGLKL